MLGFERRRWGWVMGLALAALLAACSQAPYRHGTLSDVQFNERAEAQQAGSFEVRASVPGAEESIAYFGIDLYSRDVQPIWIELANRSDTRARVVISSVDPKYFPPAEVAWFFKKEFSTEGWMALEKRLMDQALPRQVAAGATVSGFVFTNREPGTKAFNLDVYGVSIPPSYEEFTFFLTVPGFEPDYASVRFQELYAEDERVDLALAEVPGTVGNMACCTTNKQGTARGRPVNVFFVSEPFDLLRALLSAGWSEAAYEADENYLQTAHYLYGRPADGLFRKARDASTDRAELGIWRTPLSVDGTPVWAAQLRHAIGRRFPLGERLFGVRIDPDVTDGRNYLLQNIWYAQAVTQWGLVTGNAGAPPEDPALDFLGNPWFVRDDQRAVIWISEDPVSMVDTQLVSWPARESEEGRRP